MSHKRRTFAAKFMRSRWTYDIVSIATRYRTEIFIYFSSNFYLRAEISPLDRKLWHFFPRHLSIRSLLCLPKRQSFVEYFTLQISRRCFHQRFIPSNILIFRVDGRRFFWPRLSSFLDFPEGFFRFVEFSPWKTLMSMCCDWRAPCGKTASCIKYYWFSWNIEYTIILARFLLFADLEIFMWLFYFDYFDYLIIDFSPNDLTY